MASFAFPRKPNAGDLEVAIVRNNRQLEAFLTVREHVPTLEGTWANAGGGYAEALAHVDSNGWVHLQGRVDSGTNDTTILTLPTTWRPHDGADHTFAVMSSSGTQRLDVTGAGVVKTVGSSSHTWVSLDGVSFYRG